MANDPMALAQSTYEAPYPFEDVVPTGMMRAARLLSQAPHVEHPLWRRVARKVLLEYWSGFGLHGFRCSYSRSGVRKPQRQADLEACIHALSRSPARTFFADCFLAALRGHGLEALDNLKSRKPSALASANPARLVRSGVRRLLGAGFVPMTRLTLQMHELSEADVGCEGLAHLGRLTVPEYHEILALLSDPATPRDVREALLRSIANGALQPDEEASQLVGRLTSVVARESLPKWLRILALVRLAPGGEATREELLRITADFDASYQFVSSSEIQDVVSRNAQVMEAMIRILAQDDFHRVRLPELDGLAPESLPPLLEALSGADADRRTVARRILENVKLVRKPAQAELEDRLGVLRPADVLLPVATALLRHAGSSLQTAPVALDAAESCIRQLWPPEGATGERAWSSSVENELARLLARALESRPRTAASFLTMIRSGWREPIAHSMEGFFPNTSLNTMLGIADVLLGGDTFSFRRLCEEKARDSAIPERLSLQFESFLDDLERPYGVFVASGTPWSELASMVSAFHTLTRSLLARLLSSVMDLEAPDPRLVVGLLRLDDAGVRFSFSGRPAGADTSVRGLAKGVGEAITYLNSTTGAARLGHELLRQFHAGDSDVRRTVMRSLRRMSPVTDEVTRLVALGLNDPEWTVRYEAQETLYLLPNVSGEIVDLKLETVVNAISGDGTVRFKDTLSETLVFEARPTHASAVASLLKPLQEGFFVGEVKTAWLRTFALVNLTPFMASDPAVSERFLAYARGVEPATNGMTWPRQAALLGLAEMRPITDDAIEALLDAVHARWMLDPYSAHAIKASALRALTSVINDEGNGLDLHRRYELAAVIAGEARSVVNLAHGRKLTGDEHFGFAEDAIDMAYWATTEVLTAGGLMMYSRELLDTTA